MDVIEIIEKTGFPIAMTLILLFQGGKKLDAVVDSIKEVSSGLADIGKKMDALNERDDAIERRVEALERREH